MSYQITIRPALVNQTNHACKWHIKQIDSSKTETMIDAGELDFRDSILDQISSIAETLNKVPQLNATSIMEGDVNLEFDFECLPDSENAISTLDLFRLYGLLSMRLNPSTICVHRKRTTSN